MPQSPDRPAADSCRRDLRASHADRDQVVGTLKVAFVQGRLAKDEFDLRVGQALASRTYAELRAVTADLPAGLAGSEQPEPPRPAQRPSRRPALLRPGPAAALATVIYLGMWPLAIALPRAGDGYAGDGMNLVGAATLVYILVVISACVWAQVRASNRDERARQPAARTMIPGA